MCTGKSRSVVISIRGMTIMYRIKVLTIVAVAMLSLAIGQAGAGTVTVPNGDFETIYKPGTTITGVLVPADNAWTQGVGPLCPIDVGQYNFSDTTTGTVADIPGWVGYGIGAHTYDLYCGGYGQPPYCSDANRQGSVSNQGNHTPGGINMYLANGGAWGNPGGGLIVSAEPLERPDCPCPESYVLSMYVQATYEPPATPVVFDLLLDGDVVTPDAEVSPVLTEDWQEYTRTYDTLPAGDITVMIGVGRPDPNGVSGTQTRFDDVTLSYGKVIYVNADATGGDNNGTSWEDAFLSLQDALDAVVIRDEIWVAAGTYYPTWDYGLGIGDRGKHFRMINGVGIYGGFAGTETALDQRDVENNETILSGDLLGNDNPATPVDDLLDDPSRADNCYRLFYHPEGTNLDTTAILDGFTVTASNAIGSEAHDYGGGGMYNYFSSPTLTGCTFTGNSAIGGGIMYNNSSSPTVTGCTFIGNSAGHGGGISNYNSSPTVTDCTFSNNSANWGGGGMVNWMSSPRVTGCIFSGNSCDTFDGVGGGMYNYFSSPTLTGCTFTGNSANGIFGVGGGMSNEYSSSPTVTNCTFSGNSVGNDGGSGGGMHNDGSNPTVTGCTFSGNDGGGMSNDFSSSPTVTGCTFSGNDGGGMSNNFSSSPTVTNCTFTGNSAFIGGGMSNEDSSNPTVTGCTFTGNSADYYGGGMCNGNSSPTVTGCTFTDNSADKGGGMANAVSSPTVTNCILWGNTAASEGDEIFNNDSSSIPVISYCDIAGCLDGGAWDASLGTDGGGNIDADPLFVDADGADDTPGTEDDNLRLQAGSPCIDAGDNNAVTEASDLDGNVRVVDGDCDSVAVVDMGAYEFGWVYLGDFDGQCDVDLIDFAIMSAAWLSDDTPSANWSQDCDLDNSGDIYIGDLEMLGANWLARE